MWWKYCHNHLGDQRLAATLIRNRPTMANFMLSVFGSTRNVTTALRDEYRVLCDKNQEDITCNHASDRRHLKSITKALITQRYIATF